MNIIGRTTRRTYLIKSLVLIALNTWIFYSAKINSIEDLYPYSIFIWTTIIVVFILNIGRLNDINLSGWYSLIFFVPILNISLIALYFIDGTKGENKYGQDPYGRVNEKKFKKNRELKKDYLNFLKQIDESLELLEEGAKEGLLNNKEFLDRKDDLTIKKQEIIRKLENEESFNIKREKLKKLFESKIISKDEFDNKLKILNREFNVDDSNINSIDLNDKVFYVSYGKEYGPYTVKKIISMLNTGKINHNCFIRFEHESDFSKRAVQLLEILK